MNANKLTLSMITGCVAMVAQCAAAATIPAGTMLVLKTTGTISSRDAVGRQFQGRLIQSVGPLPPGTDVVGVVKSPRVAIGSSVRPLTLILTELSIDGRTVHIKTEPFEVENAGAVTRSRRARVTGNAFVFPPGTVLQFRLRQSITL